LIASEKVGDAFIFYLQRRWLRLSFS
jgi:hypothetical protein